IRNGKYEIRNSSSVSSKNFKPARRRRETFFYPEPNKNNKMTQRISRIQRFKMMNPVLQFFKYIFLSIKIMLVVAGGHGSTKDNSKLPSS
ncbi:MAG: hypothetical protein NWQ38_11115, partial [Cellulophaga sp.]|nr:hypothetical protein [Cellulophaga sp.]